MYLLAGVNICAPSAGLGPLWNVIGTIVKTLWIGIPILLIILGTIDLGKAVISSKEEEVKKAKKSFINRLIYAILVFAVVWAVGLLIGFISKIGIDKDKDGNLIIDDVGNWRNCWNQIIG